MLTELENRIIYSSFTNETYEDKQQHHNEAMLFRCMRNKNAN